MVDSFEYTVERVRNSESEMKNEIIWAIVGDIVGSRFELDG